jgi:hypothetical protein
MKPTSASMAVFTEIWTRLLAAAAALALSACGTAPLTPTESRGPVLHAAGDGALIVRMLSNNDGTNLYLKQWGAMRVARIEPAGTPVEYTVQPTLDAAARSAVYVASLPPGNYRLQQVHHTQREVQRIPGGGGPHHRPGHFGAGTNDTRQHQRFAGD